jgi:hypothetical protein
MRHTTNQRPAHSRWLFVAQFGEQSPISRWATSLECVSCASAFFGAARATAVTAGVVVRRSLTYRVFTVRGQPLLQDVPGLARLPRQELRRLRVIDYLLLL